MFRKVEPRISARLPFTCGTCRYSQTLRQDLDGDQEGSQQVSAWLFSPQKAPTQGTTPISVIKHQDREASWIFSSLANAIWWGKPANASLLAPK